MTIALWCVLAAGLIHIPFTAAAKNFGRSFDNNHPRDFLAKAEGWRRRANAVQLNSFEAFPLFAAGVITAQMLHAAQSRIDQLAIAFIVLRVIYGACYVANLAPLRSLVWFAALGCSIALFVISA